MNRPSRDETLRGAVIVTLLTSAADAWAKGDYARATKLAEGAWAVVGPNGTFEDCDECGDGA